jgi:hypothetical protein
VSDPAFVAPLPEARKLRKVFTGTFCGLGNHVDRSKRAANEAAELIAGLLLPLEERVKRLEQENRELREKRNEARDMRTLSDQMAEERVSELESWLAQVSEALRDAWYTVTCAPKLSIGSIHSHYGPQISVGQAKGWFDVLNTTPTPPTRQESAREGCAHRAPWRAPCEKCDAAAPRPATAPQMYVCNKCGYVGESISHKGCNYNATWAPPVEPERPATALAPWCGRCGTAGAPDCPECYPEPPAGEEPPQNDGTCPSCGGRMPCYGGAH